MTKKIHVSLFICSIAILLCLPSAFGNVGTYNPSDNVIHNDHATHDVHNPAIHTQIEDDEEKEMLKELMGDFDSHVDHNQQHHTGSTSDHYTQHDINSHDQLVHHENHIPKAQPGHHENPHNAHNLPKTRNPLHDRIRAEPTSDIREIGIPIDGKEHMYNVLSCTYGKIPVHHGNVDITIANLANAKKAMITTTHFKNCAELIQFHCSNHTSFCEIHDLKHESDMKIYHSIADAEEAYLYILPSKIDVDVAFKVKVSPTPGITIKEAPTSHDVCAKRNFDTCEEHPNPCHSRCVWHPCAFLEDSNINVAGGVCVSTGSDNKLAQESCLSFPDWVNAPEANRLKYEIPTCQYTPAPGPVQSHHFAAAAVFFALFMGIVCCYRYQFRKYGSGFCNPPSWCPNCLFPRKDEKLQTSFYKDIVVKHQELEMDYQPPVL